MVGERELEPSAQQQVLASYPVLQRMSGLLAQDRADAEFEESLENLLDRLDRLVAART